MDGQCLIKNLQEAGIPRKLAPTVGIAVDPRRQNLSEESLKANVERLKEYKQRLVLFPRKVKQPKAGDAPKKEVDAAKQIGSHLYDGKVKLIATGFGEVATAVNNAAAYLNPDVSAFPGHLSDYAPAGGGSPTSSH